MERLGGDDKSRFCVKPFGWGPCGRSSLRSVSRPPSATRRVHRPATWWMMAVAFLAPLPGRSGGRPGLLWERGRRSVARLLKVFGLRSQEGSGTDLELMATCMPLCAGNNASFPAWVPLARVAEFVASVCRRPLLAHRAPQFLRKGVLARSCGAPPLAHPARASGGRMGRFRAPRGVEPTRGPSSSCHEKLAFPPHPART